MVVTNIQGVIDVATSRGGSDPNCYVHNLLESIKHQPFEQAVESFCNAMNIECCYACFSMVCDVLPRWAQDRILGEVHRFPSSVDLLVRNGAIIDNYCREQLEAMHRARSR